MLTLPYDTLRDAHRADLITWDSIVAQHQRNYPRCEAHGTPTAYTLDGVAICPECFELYHDWIHQRLAEIRAGER